MYEYTIMGWFALFLEQNPLEVHLKGSPVRCSELLMSVWKTCQLLYITSFGSNTRIIYPPHEDRQKMEKTKGKKKNKFLLQQGCNNSPNPCFGLELFFCLFYNLFFLFFLCRVLVNHQQNPTILWGSDCFQIIDNLHSVLSLKASQYR